MKKETFIYRIKDINTNTYYAYRKCVSVKYPDPVEQGYTYQYSKVSSWGAEYEHYLYLNDIGHFYPTKKGAERIISEFTGTSKHQRKTPAGRLLNCRFNFVVVKSKLKLKDVEDKE